MTDPPKQLQVFKWLLALCGFYIISSNAGIGTAVGVFFMIWANNFDYERKS